LINSKTSGHKYHNCQEFLSDIELIYNNCVLYNGMDSPFTMKAEALLKTSKELLADVIFFPVLVFQLTYYFFQYGDHLTFLEGRIKLAQERALEQADMDSLASYNDDNDDNFTIVEEDRVRNTLNFIKFVLFNFYYDNQSHEEDMLQQEEGVLYIGIDGNYERGAGPSKYGKNILEEGRFYTTVTLNTNKIFSGAYINF
jgi:hypothetical protein